jgi:predicted nucleic acid-binding protein
MYILDTVSVSDLRRRRPNPGLAAWLAATDPALLRITATTVAEISYGIALARESDPGAAERLEVWLAGLLASAVVLPFEAGPARILGELWACRPLRHLATTPPGAGRLRTGGDLVIAAIALHHEATIVTDNVADFALIASHFPALSVFNPFTGRPGAPPLSAP